MVHQLEVVLPDGKLFRSLPVKLTPRVRITRGCSSERRQLGSSTEALCGIHPLPEKRSFRDFF